MLGGHYRRAGYTFAEILVVLAIIALLAALFLPALRSAKALAHRTVCASNFRQVQLSTVLYMTDYDDYFMPVNYRPELVPDPQHDRTWVQLLLPYLSSVAILQCPSDYGRVPVSQAIFDSDLVPGDTFVRYYEASLRVNVGYNYLYFSPVYWNAGSWQVRPKMISEIADDSRSILFVDSVYARSDSGIPQGGGSYVVIPPCRYGMVGQKKVDSFDVPLGARIFAANEGWTVSTKDSPFRYGLAWPWHLGKMNVARVNGSTVSISPLALSAGCDVRDDWGGFIKSPGEYAWDLN